MNNNATEADRLNAIRDRLRQFVAEREWEQFHNPKNLAMAIASEAGELLSELRWVASDQADSFVRDSRNRDRIEREVGDVCIAILLFCERAGIDFLTAVERKTELNEINYPVELSKGHSERPTPGVERTSTAESSIPSVAIPDRRSAKPGD